ncbi:hypothetical protein [Oribacterium sp. Sow4_G1_1]|uniref:hypothetical protein n=1 Tax=Oribacterium sp. Sow4_G1_1 TaxID=3438794 RepID=UPI003F98757A
MKKSLTIVIDNLIKEENQEIRSKYYDFGYKKFGPFLYAYTNWLINEIQNGKYSKVIFFSRDGYMMKRAFDIMNTGGIPSVYAYFSRKSLRYGLLCKCAGYMDSLKYLSQQRYTSVGTILDYFGFDADERNKISEKYNISLNLDIVTDEIGQNEILKIIYKDHKDIIISRSLQQRELVKRYLTQIGLDENAAIVDIGWHGSMQYYLEEFFQEESEPYTLNGFYVGIHPTVPVIGNLHGFTYDNTDQTYRKSVLCFLGVLEKLFQSKEGSTIGYSKSEEGCVVPQLADYEYKSNQRAQDAISAWQSGALDFIQRIDGSNMKYSKEEWIRPLLQFGMSPSLKDVDLFDFFYINDGKREFFTAQKPLFKYKVKELLHDLSNSPWKTGFMKSALKIKLPYYWVYKVLRK